MASQLKNMVSINKNFSYLWTNSRRYYLSKAFKCQDVWNARLNSPIFAKTNIETMYYELNSQYNRIKKINPIDADIFVNAIQDEVLLTEAEEVVHKLRLTAETHKTLPTTHHAVIRLLLAHNRNEDLVRILHDRLNYGIFPDDYCLLMLMNEFLLKKDYRMAAKIACLPMFQENYANELVNYMALFSTHKYLEAPTPWDDAADENDSTKNDENEDDDEEIKIRLSLLRNPYFDDHFDLKDGNHICGKSLIMIGRSISGALGKSYEMIGQAYYNKWDKLNNFLKNIVESNEPLYSDGVTWTSKVVEENTSETNDLGKIKKHLDQLNSRSKNISDNMCDAVETKLKELIVEKEERIIADQIELYSKWNSMRMTQLKEQLDLISKMKRLEEVEAKKKEMMRIEQELYYFDKKNEYDLLVEWKSKVLEGREKLRQSQTNAEESYVPPEVKKKYAEK